jgi:CHAT domain-containing protein/lipopolysaccharide biosynthesis regulator YciM
MCASKSRSACDSRGRWNSCEHGLRDRGGEDGSRAPRSGCICEQESRAEDNEVRQISAQAFALFEQGNFEEAKPLAERIVTLREELVEQDRSDPGRLAALETALYNLAQIHEELGELATAEPLLQRALLLCEQTFGSVSAETADSLGSLALLYQRMGDLTRALPLYQRALKIREKVSGDDHAETAKILSNLGDVYSDLGDGDRAEPLLARFVKITEQQFGPEDPKTARALARLANLYDFAGDRAKAEPLFQRILKIRQKTLGADHPDTAMALHVLGRFYEDINDYGRAELFYQEALKIRQKVLGPSDSATFLTLNRLAGVYDEIGQTSKAIMIVQEALSQLEKAPDKNDVRVADFLLNLGDLYSRADDHNEAQVNFQRAFEICEKELGASAPLTITCLTRLASTAATMKDFTRAASLCERALTAAEKTFGADHEQTASIKNNLALCYIDLNKTAEALKLARQSGRVNVRKVENILSFATEQQRLLYLQKIWPYTQFATLGSAADVAEAILRFKGLVLDSLIEDRLALEGRRNVEHRQIATELAATRGRLRQLLLEQEKLQEEEQGAQRRDTERELLQTKVEDLEKTLARGISGVGRARRALRVTTGQVQAALPLKSVLIEYLCYDHYLAGQSKAELRFGAVIISQKGAPKWVQLSSANYIRRKVRRAQEAIQESADEQTLMRSLRTLYEQLWEPLEKALPLETETVIISPDDELNFVSFATLLGGDDELLGQKYSIRYVASGRDLVRSIEPSTARNIIIYADPDFLLEPSKEPSGVSAPEVSQQLIRPSQKRNLRSVRLTALPGTAKESARLAALAKAAGWQASIFRGRDATEASLRQLQAPRILHLATHGFFLPEGNVALTDTSKAGRGVGGIRPGAQSASSATGTLVKAVSLTNPMHRSGLALAGAQRTLLAWAEGRVPSTMNDGILTAEEVAGLNLNGSWLVVLSACETGVGESAAGEGVLGLRRGFVQAGAQNLLMTLWSVEDEETARLMADFYSAAKQGGNAPRALAETQRSWLVKLRKERGLQAAVSIAGPFIMSFQGKP